MTLITTPIGISYQAAAIGKTHSKLNLAIQEQHLPLTLLVKRKGEIAGTSPLTFIQTKEKIICSAPLLVWVRMYLAYQSTPVKITNWFISGKKTNVLRGQMPIILCVCSPKTRPLRIDKGILNTYIRLKKKKKFTCS